MNPIIALIIFSLLIGIPTGGIPAAIVMFVFLFVLIEGWIYISDTLIPSIKSKQIIEPYIRVLYPKAKVEDIPLPFSKTKENKKKNNEKMIRKFNLMAETIRKETRIDNFIICSRNNFTQKIQVKKFPDNYYSCANIVNINWNSIKSMGVNKSFRYTLFLYALQNPLFRIDLQLGLCQLRDIIIVNKEEIISLGQEIYKEELVIPDWINDDVSDSENKFLVKRDLQSVKITMKKLRH